MSSITQKFWQFKTPDPQKIVVLSDSLKLDPVVAQLLINRGIDDAKEAAVFLNPGLQFLHDPFRLKDMDRAVARIKKAADRREKVLIFGDYDVDGVTSSALLFRLLRKMSIRAANHIPHRMQDGYGLNANAVNLARDEQATLLISVDCGITAVEEVKALNAAGIDVIIIDHHEPGAAGLPPAHAVIDPKRPDCAYPFKNLASVGLVAKLFQAIEGRIPDDIMDLVALGTIADVVTLKGENRILVKAGLPRLAATQNKGLAALLDVAKLKGKPFKPHYAGFIIGPRINATGRMDSAGLSLKLLLTESDDEAYDLARQLEDLNARRQQLQRGVVDEAVRMIEQEVNFKDQKVIVVGKEGWHKGVLGIVASRVADMYYRPSIIVSFEDGVGTASARSIAGFHLHEALTHCSELLENFGGHQLAAGLTIRQDKLPNFRKLINDFAQDILQIRQLTPTLGVDCEIPLYGATLDLVNILEQLEPFGEGNRPPLFASRRLMIKSRPVVLGRETLKFWVTDGRASVSAVGFGMGRYRDYLHQGQHVDLVYQLQIDDWNKAPTVQLKLEDIRESEESDKS